MNLFDELVKTALNHNQSLIALKPVVEKEILHHDILREMSGLGLIKNLVFLGGTCLRNCYGSPRLSEDLDFSMVSTYSPENIKDKMNTFGRRLLDVIKEKYGFTLSITNPKQDVEDTHTWKIVIYTKPEQPHLPAQRINIDICSVPSVKSQPVMLRNFYQIEMGTSGLILQAETKQEILADKWIALAFRPNRIKQRDLWDLQWLIAQNVNLDVSLLEQKLHLRGKTRNEFIEKLGQRLKGLEEGYRDFLFEMKRFLPAGSNKDSIENPDFWEILTRTLKEGFERLSLAEL